MLHSKQTPRINIRHIHIHLQVRKQLNIKFIPHAPRIAMLDVLHLQNNAIATHLQVQDATHYPPTTIHMMNNSCENDEQRENVVREN